MHHPERRLPLGSLIRSSVTGGHAAPAGMSAPRVLQALASCGGVNEALQDLGNGDYRQDWQLRVILRAPVRA